jgi:hypothetical protein
MDFRLVNSVEEEDKCYVFGKFCSGSHLSKTGFCLTASHNGLSHTIL